MRAGSELPSFDLLFPHDMNMQGVRQGSVRGNCYLNKPRYLAVDVALVPVLLAFPDTVGWATSAYPSITC